MKRGAHLGQHFLTSSAIARAMVEAAHVSEGDTIVEVGPGKGILTKELLEAGARVVAIEKDSEMVRVLKETFPESGALTVIEGDARNALEGVVEGAYKVVANIPYYITGELIRLFLTAPNQPQSVTLLVQKEVAERIAREKKESILSLSVKVYGEPQYVRTVKAGSFNPPPKVDSAILHIAGVSRKHFTDAAAEERFFKIVKAGFAQKRKTLLGNLSGITDREKMRVVFEELGLNAKVRAEDVPLETWLRLVRLS